MPVKAKTVSYEDIQKLFAIPTESLDETKRFLDGDHWQEGKGWIGWQPDRLSTTSTSANDWRLIEEGFTPKNVIFGMVKRLKGAVLGKEPDWEIVSAERSKEPEVMDPEADPERTMTPAEKKYKDIDDIVTKWWSEKKIHRSLKQFIHNKAAFGKASLRIYIPSGYVKESADGRIGLDIKNRSDLAEVLSKIYVDAPHYSSITDVEDTEYGTDFTILQMAKDENAVDTNTSEKIYELCYVDDQDGKTYLRQVEQKTQSDSIGRIVSVDLGGNLLTYVDGAYTDALISKPVKQQQKQLNHANTMEGYAVANINFPPTYFGNAVTEVETRNAQGKKATKQPGLLAGFGQWVGLVGLSVITADGSEDIKDPSITFQPTGKPEDFAKVAKNKAADMHEEAGMLYVFLADNPYPSGESRIEAMTDYIILLVDYTTLCDNAGEWLLTTVLRLANNFMDKTAENDKFNVIFSTKPTIGRISTDDKRLMLEEVNSGLRSKRNYMITAEVADDPASELKVIRIETPPVDPNADPNADPNKKPAPKPAPQK